VLFASRYEYRLIAPDNITALLTGDPTTAYHAIAHDPLTAAVLSVGRDQAVGERDVQAEPGISAAVQTV
jgi:hypothetical protein